MKSHWRKLLYLLPSPLERKYYDKYFLKEHQKWEQKRTPFPVSNLSKQRVLIDYQKKYGIKILVETGTYLGDTLYCLYSYFEKLYSIELSEHYYSSAKKRFKKFSKINLLEGDSGLVLKQLVPTFDTPAIFWLDGHYSEGLTAKGEKECPIYEELIPIFSSPFQHLIFIDDARLFIGKNDYPTTEELKEFIQLHKPQYNLSIVNDCIRLLPNELKLEQ